MPPAMKLTDQIWEPRGDRKLLKHIQEKRRRERINYSLEVLRTLLMEATEDQRFRSPKAEKAEILKTTVDFLKLQPLPDDKLKEERKLQRYQSGYQECLLHATQFLKDNPKLCAEKRSYLMERLEKIPQTPHDPRTEKDKTGSSPAPSTPTQTFKRIARGHFAQRGMLQASPPQGTSRTLQNSHMSSPQGESADCQGPTTSSPQGETTRCRNSSPPSHTGPETPKRPEREARCKRKIQQSASPPEHPASTPPSSTTSVWRPWP
ncbi:transcription factor HES-5-like [Lissotriton helveticus]